MPQPRADRPADSLPQDRRQALLRSLRQPPMASQFPPSSITLVLALRLMARCIAEGRDPLAELACRLKSMAAAKAVFEFAQACAQGWPERVQVNRPCCHALTPDEVVFAQMAQAAANANRAQFDAVLDGLIRRERHDRLYRHSQDAVATLLADL